MSNKKRGPRLVRNGTMPTREQVLAAIQQQAAGNDTAEPNLAVSPVLCPFCTQPACQFNGHLLPQPNEKGEWVVPMKYGIRCICTSCGKDWLLMLVQPVDDTAKIILCKSVPDAEGKFEILDAGLLEASRAAALQRAAALSRIVLPGH